MSQVIAITGGTGFVGRHLVEWHRSLGDRVHVLTRAPRGGTSPDMQFFVGDITAADRSLLQFLDGADVLYHCAGETTHEQRMHDLHVAGTQRLLDAAAGRIQHWVQLSSVGVYGPIRVGMAGESRPFAPIGAYEVTKAESENLLRSQAIAKGFSFSILRPSMVFGPGMPNNSLRQLVRIIDLGIFFFIGQSGAIATYVAAEEVAYALWLCATHPAAKNQAYNLSQDTDMESFIGIIASALKRKAPKLRIPEKLARTIAQLGRGLAGFPLTPARVDALTTRVRYDSSKISTQLGFKPLESLDRRIAEFVSSCKATAG